MPNTSDCETHSARILSKERVIDEELPVERGVSYPLCSLSQVKGLTVSVRGLGCAAQAGEFS